jgi:hypothetical protein
VRGCGPGAILREFGLANPRHYLPERHPGGLVVDDRATPNVNTIGFDFPGGEFAPGPVVLATPDGTVREVARDVGVANGMAITPRWPNADRR